MRKLGKSDLMVSSVGFGCWPIAGISSLGVTHDASVQTLLAAKNCGINFFDTAFSYGYQGEADHLLREALSDCRDDLIIASKVGANYDASRNRVVDGRPSVLLDQAEKILKRLDTDHVDLMYLHQPDPSTPIEESAGAIQEIVQRGWSRYAGVSNVDLTQLQRFESECPVIAVQIPYNMQQPESWLAIREYCLRKSISAVCYWVLMKGLLTGKLARDHQFDPRDRRLTYPIYQGEAWQRSQDFLDRLRQLAVRLGTTVSQLVVAWTLQQPGIDVALLGAKRPEQIEETAQAMDVELEPAVLLQIDQWLGKSH
jgi:aryl-alcohol dehydrogenase-like predicted oxidoreductase